MDASREAFDLHSPACRQNFRRAFRRKWRSPSWWRLVAVDTFGRVCSRKEPQA